MFLSEWREFPLAPCLAGKKRNLMTAHVSMLLKSLASLTCFRACFLPGRAKDLSAPGNSLICFSLAVHQYYSFQKCSIFLWFYFCLHLYRKVLNYYASSYTS